MKKGLAGFFLAIVMMLAAVIGFAVWFIRKCLRVHELKREVVQDIRKYIRYAMDGSFRYRYQTYSKYHDFKKPTYASYLYTNIQDYQNQVIRNIENLTFDSQKEAEEYITDIQVRINEFGDATVEEVYDIFGFPKVDPRRRYLDSKFSWWNLDLTCVTRIYSDKDKTRIRLPLPERRAA